MTMKNNRDSYIKEMHVYRKKVLESQKVLEYLSIALIAGTFIIWLTHVLFPYSFSMDECEVFVIGYSFILFLFLLGNWIKRMRLEGKYKEVYKKLIDGK